MSGVAVADAALLAAHRQLTEIVRGSDELACNTLPTLAPQLVPLWTTLADAGRAIKSRDYDAARQLLAAANIEIAKLSGRGAS